MLDVVVLPLVFAVMFPVLRVLLKKHVFQVTWGSMKPGMKAMRPFLGKIKQSAAALSQCLWQSKQQQSARKASYGSAGLYSHKLRLRMQQNTTVLHGCLTA